MSYTSDNRSVAQGASWLGATGVLPFIALAIIPHTSLASKVPESALLTYGAIILSFLGGLLWGMVLNGSDTIGGASRLLTFGVIASLVGWGALFLPLTAGLLTLTTCFLALLAMDFALYRAKKIPFWYMKLRIFLTSTVSLTLIISAFV